jgi:hypothetical protein
MAHIKKLIAKDTWKDAVISDKKKDWTVVTASVLTDVLAGVVGGAVGSFFGPFAVPAGAACSATGHATGHRWLTAFGIGCIASPFDPLKAAAYRTANPKFDLKAEMEAGKSRMKDYMEMLKEKFFINKLKGSGTTSNETSEDSQQVSGLDQHVGKATLDALTEFDQQIMSDGIEYQAHQNSAGVGVNGVEELEELPHII